VSHLTYQPFYTGPRTCIGNKLALAEFKVLLSMLVRNFVFQPVEGFHIGKRSFPLAKPEPHIELIVSRVEN
jgi:cytochrome P450